MHPKARPAVLSCELDLEKIGTPSKKSLPAALVKLILGVSSATNAQRDATRGTMLSRLGLELDTVTALYCRSALVSKCRRKIKESSRNRCSSHDYLFVLTFYSKE